MSRLVIKSWQVEKSPFDDRGTLVRIEGRSAGLMSFVLALLRIDPTTRMVVTTERLEFSTASLSGSAHRIIPLQNICSSYYGYSKPWKMSLFLWLLVVVVSSVVALDLGVVQQTSQQLFLIGWIALIASLLALVHYALNLRLTLAFVENSGFVSMIEFKRSVLENKRLSEADARDANVVSLRAIEAKLKRGER